MLLPLGEDLYAYSVDHILSTVKASGELNLVNIAAIFFIFGSVYFILSLGKYISMTFNFSAGLTTLCYAFIITYNFLPENELKERPELEKNLIANKYFYF